MKQQVWKPRINPGISDVDDFCLCPSLLSTALTDVDGLVFADDGTGERAGANVVMNWLSSVCIPPLICSLLALLSSLFLRPIVVGILYPKRKGRKLHSDVLVFFVRLHVVELNCDLAHPHAMQLLRSTCKQGGNAVNGRIPAVRAPSHAAKYRYNRSRAARNHIQRHVQAMVINGFHLIAIEVKVSWLFRRRKLT